MRNQFVAGAVYLKNLNLQAAPLFYQFKALMDKEFNWKDSVFWHQQR